MGRYLFINAVKPPLKDTPKEGNLPTKDSVLLYTLHTHWRTTSLQRTVSFYTHSIHIPPYKGQCPYTLHTHWRATSLQRTVSFYTHSIHIGGQPPYKGQCPSVHIGGYKGQLSGWVLSMSIIWRFHVYLIVGWLKG